MGKDSKAGRGGRRPGAGRPKGDSRLYTFRASGDIARALDAQEDRTAFIRDSIRKSLGPAAQQQGQAALQPTPATQQQGQAAARPGLADTATSPLAPDFSRLGRAVPATRARGLSVPAFSVRMVAGFPVPLDNDERSQDIDMLRLLCPHPESSYLVRVQGESMIDAGIEDGDIVIVDKSRRDPSGKEIAVCELNGEYTLKRIATDKDGTRWLVPANPDFPRFPISDGDTFCVWGIVTYIIHKARD